MANAQAHDRLDVVCVYVALTNPVLASYCDWVQPTMCVGLTLLHPLLRSIAHPRDLLSPGLALVALQGIGQNGTGLDRAQTAFSFLVDVRESGVAIPYSF